MNNSINSTPLEPPTGDGARLSEAYDLWQRAPHPHKPGTLNKNRSATDLLNYKRALSCFAAGFSYGSKSAERLPLTALEVSESLVSQYVSNGATLLTSRGTAKVASKKTISNLVSCLRSIRTVVLNGRNVPIRGKSAKQRLDELPKRRSRPGFPKAAWPKPFSTEWQGYRKWKLKPLLTPSEGSAFRREPCRPVTIDEAHVSSINPYVGFLVRECSMSTFSLAEACSAELFGDFINWHMSQDADGGYGLLK